MKEKDDEQRVAEHNYEDVRLVGPYGARKAAAGINESIHLRNGIGGIQRTIGCDHSVSYLAILSAEDERKCVHR